MLGFPALTHKLVYSRHATQTSSVIPEWAKAAKNPPPWKGDKRRLYEEATPVSTCGETHWVGFSEAERTGGFLWTPALP